MKHPLAHRIIRPSKPYVPACATDITKTIREAKKNGPLLGPVVVVEVPALDMMHPLHARNVGRTQARA